MDYQLYLSLLLYIFDNCSLVLVNLIPIIESNPGGLDTQITLPSTLILPILPLNCIVMLEFIGRALFDNIDIPLGERSCETPSYSGLLTPNLRFSLIVILWFDLLSAIELSSVSTYYHLRL